MSLKDKQKWDEKYSNTPKLLEKRTPSPKLKKFAKKSCELNALDFACGNGRNSLYLAKLGYIVDAYDISHIPLDNLDNMGINSINTKQIDLENFVPDKKYDLILMCNYLDRDAIHVLSDSLKKDGMFIIETYMHHESNEKPGSNPDFLLKPDELKSFFNEDFEVLDYDEFDNALYELYRMRKQSIVVKKR
jgi:SAM-dependent methyltransferase